MDKKVTELNEKQMEQVAGGWYQFYQTNQGNCHETVTVNESSTKDRCTSAGTKAACVSCKLNC